MLIAILFGALMVILVADLIRSFTNVIRGDPSSSSDSDSNSNSSTPIVSATKSTQVNSKKKN
jgi:hypothetical protein